MRENSDKPGSSHSFASLWIGLTILVVVAGIVAASSYMIESLDENSKKLRLYKVKKAADLQKSAAHDIVAFNDTKKPRYSKSRDLYFNGDLLLAQLQSKKASKCYEQSIQALMDEKHGQKLQIADEARIASCHSKIAMCYSALSQYQTAIKYATLATEEDPTCDRYFLQRSKLYSLSGRKDLSDADLKRAHSAAKEYKESLTEGKSLIEDGIRDMLDSDAATSHAKVERKPQESSQDRSFPHLDQ